METQAQVAPSMMKPEERHRRSGLGITAKLFLATAGVVALAILGAVGWTSRKADEILDKSVREAFAATRHVFDNIQAERFDKLKRLNALVAGDSVFRAVILETDEATQKDDLKTRQESLGADLVFATDSEGKLLARTDEQGARGDDLAPWPLVARALAGESAAGLLAQGGKLYHAVSLPIGTPGEDLAGVLVSGYLLDDRLAGEMKRTTGTEVGFVSLADGKPSLAAATLARPEEVAPLVAFAMTELTASSADPKQVDIAGQSFLGGVTPLVTATGEKVGALLILRSIAGELANFRSLQRSILAVGVVAILLALLVSGLLASRMTGPLRKLSAVAESVTDGNYGVEVPSYGGDEVGALAAAVRAMVRELKEKAELEKYVASLGSDPAQAPTLATAAAPSASVPSPTNAPTIAAPLASSSATGTGTASLEPRPGELFASRYEVLEVIGAGGMGKVYKVRDRDLDEVVALKTIRKDVLGSNPEVAERFKQEIKLARKATHKNILRTFDFGDAGGVQYLTMEYVKGWTLRELVRKQKSVPLGIGLRIAKQVCTGLYAAHDAGIVHRDVKSQNILIQPNGELKVMDFGIATPKESTGLTSAGSIVGTPEFIAPEQALGRDTDARSDIYSAGIVFYELFAGRLPFRGEAPIEVMMRHVKEPPPLLRQLKPGLPAELEAIVARMVEKEPARRFQSFAEVYTALSRVPVPAPAKPAPQAA